MKLNHIILLNTLLFSLVISSCNKLRNDKAPKDGITVKEKEVIIQIQGFGIFNPKPDSIVAFLWPSEEYYERYKKLGTISEETYEDYITRVSSEVFSRGDRFDDATREYLTDGKVYEKEIAKIDEELAPILSEIKSIQDQIGVFKKELKKLGKEKKKLKSEKRKLSKRKSELTKKLTSLEKEREELNCGNEGQQNDNIDNERCAELVAEINEVTEEKEGVSASLKENSSQIKEIAKKEKKIKSQDIKKLFNLKKEITKMKLDPLNEKKRIPLERLDDIITRQSMMLGLVQSALDHQSVVIETDEEGNQTRSIDENKQVNWIKLYETTAGSSNYFKIEGKTVHIKFNEWGELKASYKTSYKRSEDGDIVYNSSGFPTMNDDSDVYDMDFDGQMIEFKIREKDKRGNLTGKVLSFKLEVGDFSGNMIIQGDLNIISRDVVVRRGQIKLILTRVD